MIWALALSQMIGFGIGLSGLASNQPLLLGHLLEPALMPKSNSFEWLIEE